MAHPLTVDTVIQMDDRLRTVVHLHVEISSIETGDYVVPGKLVIEWKTASDLVDSAIDDCKRLFWQTDRIASPGMRGMLLSEGNIYRQTNMHLPAISGTLSYLAAIQGVAVLPTLSLEHSAYIIVKLTRHAVEGFGYDLRLRGAGSKDPSHATAFVTEGIPGVSATTARGFHSRFGSVTGLFAASYDDLLATPGIGPKMARLIYDTLRAVPPA